MLKVRFPNGQCITYNDLNSIDSRDNFHYLCEKKGCGTYSVIVPINCIIEHINPCKIENPLTELTLDKAFDMVDKAIEERDSHYDGYFNDFKRLLKKFNSTTWEWKK